MREGGQRHAPAALPSGKTRYPLYRGPRGHPGRCERVRKISYPTGIRSLDRPTRSELLYRLSYPGSPKQLKKCTSMLVTTLWIKYIIKTAKDFVACFYIVETNLVLLVTVLPSCSSGISTCKNFGKETRITVIQELGKRSFFSRICNLSVLRQRLWRLLFWDVTSNLVNFLLPFFR